MYMLDRPFWMSRLQSAWRTRRVVWLAGVRRVGKTSLVRMLPSAVYLNCDLPSTARRVEDPELLYRSLPDGTTVVFDEIHRLPDPSRVLKIGADEFPSLRLLATGSSTLAATRKFRDSLTGRKTVIHLTPVLWTECEAGFGPRDLDHRLLRGGLPDQLLAASAEAEWYSEWMDSFYARDIQELFGVRERTGFLNLLRLMLRQSGGLADYSALARECDMARQTVKAHLEALAVTCAIVPVPPFHGGGRRELVRRPKIYGFDTGFVAFVRGWTELRLEDRGPLWEHLVLDVLRAGVAGRQVSYWRDKSDREVDFVVPSGRQVDAIECKIRPDRIDAKSLLAFREAYPAGRNFVVSPYVDHPYDFMAGPVKIRAIGCADLLASDGAGLKPCAHARSC
jgi:predicted AAA+ superfamily ATPase